MADLRVTRRILEALLCMAILGTLAGCGGRTGARNDAGATGPDGEQAVSIALTVAWPVATPTRAIPVLTASLRVHVYRSSYQNGDFPLKSYTFTRIPGEATSTYSLDGVPVSSTPKDKDTWLLVEAYPEASASAPLGVGTTGFFTVNPGPNNDPIRMSMASTIARIGITPKSPSVSVGATVALAATAYDSEDRIVLTSGTKWQWQLATGSAVGTLTPNADRATFTGTAAGSATVRATETESGKTGQTTASVSAATPVVVTVSPASVTLSPSATQQFTATVTGTSNTAVTWWVVDSGGGGITSSGLYTAPGSAGTYHVNAISNADALKYGTATVTVVQQPSFSSYIRLVSGTVNGQPVSSSDYEITVSPGSSITGSVTIEVKNNQDSTSMLPIIGTPNWGSHQSSYWGITSWSQYGIRQYDVPLDLQAPSAPGTYYIIFAGAWETRSSNVASGTSWNVGADQWNDGNDIADWSSSTIELAAANGYVLGVSWLLPSGIGTANCIASAIRVRSQ